MKILIVEDNPVNYRMLQSLLSQYGETEVAVNGKTGLAAFERAYQKANPIELIFLDLVMPEMDGHEMLRLIREFEKSKGVTEEDRQVKVVISTNQETTQDVILSYEQGAHHYFLKPYSPSELEDLMSLMGYVKIPSA